MKVTVTVKRTETVTFETGDIPGSLVRDLLVKNNGTFDGNWSLYDLPRPSVEDVVDSVEVIEG